MKLSKLGEVADLDERREMLARVTGALKDGGEIKLSFNGRNIAHDEVLDEKDAPQVFLELRCYFAKLLTEIEIDLQKLGVELDDGEPVKKGKAA